MKDFTLHRYLIKEFLKDCSEKENESRQTNSIIGLIEAIVSKEFGKYIGKST